LSAYTSNSYSRFWCGSIVRLLISEKSSPQITTNSTASAVIKDGEDQRSKKRSYKFEEIGEERELAAVQIGEEESQWDLGAHRIRDQ